MKTAVRWGSATHQGRIRDHNEDAVLAGPQVFAVADGMGGHAGGAVASALTVATLASAVGHDPTTGTVRAALAQSNAAIVDRGVVQGTPGMGSTVAGIAPTGKEGIVVFSVGDSRVYLRRDDAFDQLTDDDSVVAELVRDGTLTEAEARSRPDRNVITKALGVDDEIDPQIFEIERHSGDVFVIASDGLFTEVSDATIASVAGEPSSEDHRARKLMDLALEHGGRDNISVVVVTVIETTDIEDLSEDTNPSPIRLTEISVPDVSSESAPPLITSAPVAPPDVTPRPSPAGRSSLIDSVPASIEPDDDHQQDQSG